MPAIVITNMSPGQLIERAKQLSEEIIKLVEAPTEGEDEVSSRVREIARRGVKLAETYIALDAMAESVLDTAFGSSQSSSDAHPGSQGCAPKEGDPTTN